MGKIRDIVLFMPRMLKKVYRVWRQGGLAGVAKSTKIKINHYYYENFLNNNAVWLASRHKFSRQVAPVLKKKISRFTHQPKISIIIPVYNTPEKWLREAIGSVQAQLYPNWELCIVDDASPSLHVRKILEEYASKDSRIKVDFLTKNSGVAIASNQALELVTGEFVMLMDHDDLIIEEALFRVVESIIEDAPDMIYSDESIITPEGSIFYFAYRPMFSLEYLRSHPYIVHFVGFKTDLIKQIGGFNPTLKISQDYDLILRIVEQAKTIVHIPQVLYLWRIHQSSAGHQKQTEVMNTSRQIIQRHLDRSNVLGKVENGVSFNYYQVRYELQSQQKVAIIIPTKNCGELVRQCINSIATTVKKVDYDIVIVDHASDDLKTIDYFKTLENEHQVIRYEGIFNFSAINNWAVAQIDRSRYTHYLFCNNDIEAIEADWLERMVELAQKPDVGIVGAKLLYPDRSVIQHAGVEVGMFGAAEHYGKFMLNSEPDGTLCPGYLGALFVNKEMSAVTAACMLMRRDAFEQVGGFDEKLAVGFGDVDLCLRSRAAGYRVMFCSQAVLIHHESYSRGKSSGDDPHPEDSLLFVTRWQKFMQQGDPYYNPNLSLTSTHWEFVKPILVNIEVKRRVYYQANLGKA